MNRDPHTWSTLGRRIRGDRERQGLTREDVVELVEERGGKVTTRTIGNLESGLVPKRRDKPAKLESVVAVLGWPPDRVDRFLDGDGSALDDVDTRPEARPARVFNDPRAQAIWELDLPLREREQGIRDLLEADLRRAREQEEAQADDASGRRRISG